MRIIAHELHDGSVIRTTSFEPALAEMVVSGMTEPDALNAIARHARPDALRWVEVTSDHMSAVIAHLRSDVSGKSTLRLNGDEIEWDMVQAREVHKDNLRKRRGPLLAALDVAYQRADEDGDTAEKQRIVAKKQVLRDCTDDPAIEASATPEELIAAIPDVFEP